MAIELLDQREVTDVLHPERVTRVGPEVLLGDRAHRDPPVARLVDAVAGHPRQPATDRLRVPAAARSGPGGEDVGHRDVERVALAGSDRADERGADRERGRQPAGEVGPRDGHTRRRVTTLGHQHAGHRLVAEVVTGREPHRTVLPEARDRAVHDVGVHGPDRVGTDPEPVDHSGPEALGDDVGVGRELECVRQAVGRLEVDHDAALVRGDGGEDVGELPHRVAARRLDVQHVGAEIGEQLGGIRARAARSRSRAPGCR